MLRHIVLLGGALLCIVAPLTPSHAGDTSLNGFVRAAAGLTNNAERVGRIDKRGSTDETHFGINVARELDSQWSVAGQLFATGGEGAEYAMDLDWAYLTHRTTNNIKFNVGKIKYPNLLVSEYYDIGIAYPWVRPPQEIYAADVGERPNLSLESFVGGMAVYDGAIGQLDYALQLYSGNAHLDKGALRKITGMKFKVGSETVSLIAGYNMHTPEHTVAEDGITSLPKNNHTSTALSFGAMVDWRNLVLMSEYAQGTVDKITDLDTTALYATLGYRISAVMPHITYAKLDAEKGDSSLTAGVKIQLSPAVTLKFDYQQVTPTVSIGTPPEGFNIYSGAIDLVF